MDPGSSRHKRCSCFMSTHRIFYCFVLSVLLLCFPGSSLSYSPCHVSLLSSQSTAFYLVNYHFYVRPCHDATDQYILTSSPSLICHWIYLLEAVMCGGGGGGEPCGGPGHPYRRRHPIYGDGSGHHQASMRNWIVGVNMAKNCTRSKPKTTESLLAEVKGCGVLTIHG